MKYIILSICLVTFQFHLLSQNTERDPRSKDQANVYWNGEYPLYSMLDDIEIKAEENGNYKIWTSTNESLSPNYTVMKRNRYGKYDKVSMYKFGTLEECIRWCEKKRTNQYNNTYTKYDSLVTDEESRLYCKNNLDSLDSGVPALDSSATASKKQYYELLKTNTAKVVSLTVKLNIDQLEKDLNYETELVDSLTTHLAIVTSEINQYESFPTLSHPYLKDGTPTPIEILKKQVLASYHFLMDKMLIGWTGKAFVPSQTDFTVIEKELDLAALEKELSTHYIEKKRILNNTTITKADENFVKKFHLTLSEKNVSHKFGHGNYYFFITKSQYVKTKYLYRLGYNIKTKKIDASKDDDIFACLVTDLLRCFYIHFHAGIIDEKVDIPSYYSALRITAIMKRDKFNEYMSEQESHFKILEGEEHEKQLTFLTGLDKNYFEKIVLQKDLDSSLKVHSSVKENLTKTLQDANKQIADLKEECQNDVAQHTKVMSSFYNYLAKTSTAKIKLLNSEINRLDNIKKADEAMKAKNYKSAIDYFQNAEKARSIPSVQAKLEKAKEIYAPILAKEQEEERERQAEARQRQREEAKRREREMPRIILQYLINNGDVSASAKVQDFKMEKISSCFIVSIVRVTDYNRNGNRFYLDFSVDIANGNPCYHEYSSKRLSEWDLEIKSNFLKRNYQYFLKIAKTESERERQRETVDEYYNLYKSRSRVMCNCNF